MFKVNRAAASGLEKLARVIEAHPWKVIGMAMAAIAVLGWLAATQLGVQNNVNDLVKSDAVIHSNYLRYKKEFNIREEIVLVIKSGDFEANKEVANFLGARFKQRPEDFQRIYYRHDFSKMRNRMLHYAPKEELEGIVSKLGAYKDIFDKGDAGAGMDFNSMLAEAVARFDEQELRSRRGWQEFKPFIDEFIINLNDLARELGQEVEPDTTAQEIAVSEDRLAEMERQLAENEYLTVYGGKIVVMLLSPTEGDDESFAPFKQIITAVRADVDAAREKFPDVSIGVTGEPVLLDDELTQSTQDSIQAAIITFILISILFFLAYRELVRPSLAIIALVFSIGWTMGLTTITIGHLNIISQACVIMLLGLGIDFGIQILGRYEEEMAKGNSIDDALVETLRHTGVAILTGGSTTAVAFFTMCFNEFIGLAELGIISGSGILMSVIANLVFLPAMLVVRDKRRQRQLDRPLNHTVPVFRQVIDQKLFSQPMLVLAVVVLATVYAGWSARNVGFDFNLLNLQNPKMESVQYELDLVESSSSGTIFGVIIADNRNEARELRQQLLQKPTVDSVRTLEDLLPENAEAKREVLRQIKAKLDDLDFKIDFGKGIDVAEARKQLKALLAASTEGLDMAEKHRVKAKLVGKGGEVQEAIDLFGKLIPPLQRAVDQLEGLDDEDAGRRLNRYQAETFGKMQQELNWLRNQQFEGGVTLNDLPLELRTRYLSENGKVLLEVNPKENVWEEDANRAFVADLRSVDPKATGTPVQNLAYIMLLRDSYVEAAGLAALAILILIFIHFRSIVKVILTMIPLALGVIWTGGVMAWFHIDFNPANIITLPLVIGIGVAFGVYVVDRHREDGAVKLFSSSTGKAILLSAMTTIIGFSSMMTGDYVGLRSLGLVMTIGIFFCFLSSSLVLPQLLVLLDRRRGKKPRHSLAQPPEEAG
ncbi:MAG: MMPL family transporter [Verrucomicrobiota bacterium]